MGPGEFEAKLIELVHATGPEAAVVLFLSSAVEYVFPPWPGDVLTAAGAIWALEGVLPFPVLLASTTLGSVAGAAISYELGARLVGRASSGRAGRLLRWLAPPERIQAVHRLSERWGTWLVLFNRFVPGVRGLFFVAAGAGGMPRARVLTLGAVSALGWNALLLGVGWGLGRDLTRLLEWLRGWAIGGWALLALVIIVAIARRIRARRRASSR